MIKWKYLTLIWFVITVVLFFMFAFAIMELNPMNWCIDARVILMIMSGSIFLILSITKLANQT